MPSVTLGRQLYCPVPASCGELDRGDSTTAAPTRLPYDGAEETFMHGIILIPSSPSSPLPHLSLVLTFHSLPPFICSHWLSRRRGDPNRMTEPLFMPNCPAHLNSPYVLAGRPTFERVAGISSRDVRHAIDCGRTPVQPHLW